MCLVHVMTQNRYLSQSGKWLKNSLGYACAKDSILPWDTSLCREVGCEGLTDPDGLSSGVVSKSSQTWQWLHLTCLDVHPHCRCLGCPPQEVMENTGGFNTHLCNIRVNINGMPVHPPLGRKDPKGIFNNQPSSGQTVVKNAMLSWKDASGEWSHEVSP